MKNIIKFTVIQIIFCCTFSLSSCDYLDIAPSEILTEELIYSNIKLAEQDLGSLYHDVLTWTAVGSNDRVWRDGAFNELGPACDEMMDHWENGIYITSPFKYGEINSGSIPWGTWARNYTLIRKATNFIDKIESVPLDPREQVDYQEKVKQYKEEARFLRAYLYFDLFRQYGAVPLITTVQNVSDIEAAKVARTPVDEVVKFICEELDIAAADNSPLPDFWTEDLYYGRISRAACLALKARTLLYAASPLFNGNTMYKDIKNDDGTQLFPQEYNHELWKQAADAAQKAIECCLRAGISISYEGTNPQERYEKIFFDNQNNQEIILPIINAYGVYNDRNCISHATDRYGWGKLSIMQNQVDAYETANGYLPFLMDDDGCIIYDKDGYPTINPESGYKEVGFTNVGQLWDGTSWQPCVNIYKDLWGNVVKNMGTYDLYNMYVNRDPRFYASVTFQGAKFRNETDMVERCHHFAFWRNQEQYNGWWVDGYPNSGTNNETGYGLRKFLNPYADLKNMRGTNSNYPLFRLSEMYLIKAEALNEYLDVPNDEIYSAVNETRKRVDMPELPVTNEDRTKIGMRKRIRNERRVELFYEGHRFWDVRRWKVGDRCFGIPNYKMNSQPSDELLLNKARELGYVSMTDEATNPAYAEQRVWDSREVGLLLYYKRTICLNSTFLDKMYLFPIPQGDINKNLKLKQNYGY